MKLSYLIILFLLSCSNNTDDQSVNSNPPEISGVIVETLVSNLASAESLILFNDGSLITPSNPGTLLKIYLDGTSSTLLSGLGSIYGGGIDNNGLYYVSAWTGSTVYRINLDNSKTAVATISQPVGIVFDSLNNMYVNSFNGNAIYKVTPEGDKTVFATNQDGQTFFSGPDGIVLVKGTFYTINYFNSNINAITSDGIVSHFASLPGTTTGYLTFANNNFYAASISTNKIYKISLTGTVTVLAGTGSSGTSDGTATQASFSGPNGIVASATGDTLFVDDNQNLGTPQRTSSIRMIIFNNK